MYRVLIQNQAIVQALLAELQTFCVWMKNSSLTSYFWNSFLYYIFLFNLFLKIELNVISRGFGVLGFWGNYGYFPGSVYVTSAAFWSLKNVSLSYVVPQKYLEKAGLSIVKQVSIGLVGSNLLLFVPKLNTWTNPEFSEDTGNATGTNTINETPPTRTFGANVIFTF